MGSSGKASKSKDKAFSSKGKIEKHNSDGSETILIMGRPFRIVKKLSEKLGVSDDKSSKKSSSKKGKELLSYTVVVENIEGLPMFARHVVVKRTFFKVDEVLLAHREPEVLNRIRDKGILRVFHSEVTRSEGRLGTTVAMEYCPGNLEKRLQQEPRILEGEVVQILLALSSVLGYLHSRQPPIAHRAIYPGNVLINAEAAGANAYRLCNFRSAVTHAYQCENHEEMAAAMEDISRHTIPGYRAPEMVDPTNHKRIDERVDMWSLGVLLYHIMYQRLPFTDACWGLARKPKLQFPTENESWYCGSLRVVLEHLLEPDPEQRWDAFALINFVRFDDDLNKHIGPFCFTLTERPEGWEPQDVKVIGRPVPDKVLPEGVCGTTQVGEGNAVPGGNESEQAALRTAAALGREGDLAYPGLLAHCEKMISEQEKAWQEANSKVKAGGDLTKSGDALSLLGMSGNEGGVSQKNEASAIDDLFGGGVSQPTPSPNPTSDDLFGATPAPAANAQGPTTSQSASGGNNDNWKNSLFDVQEQQMQGPPGFSMPIDSSWETGAPLGNYVPNNTTASFGNQQAQGGWGEAPPASGFPGMPQQQAQGGWGGAPPASGFPGMPQQQAQGGWGGAPPASGFPGMPQQQAQGGWGEAPPAPGFPGMPQQQAQGGWGGAPPASGFPGMPQQQAQGDRGAVPTQGFQAMQQPPQQTENKDPFSSLFS
uniref:non-specific serine/threonine protein kinase n=1 Tax=Trypanosoma congolense (strain IL3000) TaxID=1068625 RepID=G0UTW7_TRYCI|nr:putative protein kinase [Trypanosoma congolense IL3000]